MMDEYEITPRRIGMIILGLLAFIFFPFGGTAAGVAEWAIRRRDG